MNPSMPLIATSVGPQVGAVSTPPPRTHVAATGRAFASTLSRAIDAVNAQSRAADTAVQDMVASQGANLHETMIELEKAEIATRLAVKIGQKLVQAYQEVSRMQV